MTADEGEVRQVLARREKAIYDRDPHAVIATTAGSLVTFDLQPPLAFRGAAARDATGLSAWFETWEGPISMTTQDPQIISNDELAVAFGLTRLKGVSDTGDVHESWFRSTFVLNKISNAWLIVHEHHSYPMRMDGSTLAAIDLRP